MLNVFPLVSPLQLPEHRHGCEVRCRRQRGAAEASLLACELPHYPPKLLSRPLFHSERRTIGPRATKRLEQIRPTDAATATPAWELEMRSALASYAV